MDSIISQRFIHSPEQPFGSESFSLPSHSKGQSSFQAQVEEVIVRQVFLWELRSLPPVIIHPGINIYL